jgi:flap endonuclease-1
MGIDIGDLFKKERISFSDLHNRIIVIDAFNVIYQFLSSIRQRDGTPLKNSKGEITSHLSGLFSRTANLIDANIRPVYVFDGKPHPLKTKTLEKRKKLKQIAEKEYIEALEAHDFEKARSKAQQTSRITEDIIKQSKELLVALGVPHIQAPSEGEAQASYIVKKGDAFAVGSQDYDCLLVGAPILVRDLTSSKKRKIPGKHNYSQVYPKQIKLNNNLEILGITHKQLVDMAILIGTDYNDGIKGIGPKKSLLLIKKNGNIKNTLATMKVNNAPKSEEIDEIRNLFLRPTITEDYDIFWTEPDKEQVLKILCDKNQFKQERVETVLEKYSRISDIMKQKTLF